MTKPITRSRLPGLSPEHLQSIGCQLPLKSRTQLQSRLFFLALEKGGGISHEFSPNLPLSRSPSKDSRSASQEIGGDLRSPITPVAGREPPGESEAPISVDRPGGAPGLAQRPLR